MRGRIFGIKKTTILRCSFIFAWILSFLGIALSVWLFHDEQLWFFFFTFFQGFHLLLKGAFFNLDSSSYFGLSLVFVGISGIVTRFVQNIQPFVIALYFLSFGLSSFIIGIKFKQKYQIILSFLLFFVATNFALFKLKLFSLPIFLAIIGVLVLSFILENIVFFAKRKRS